MLLYGYMCSVCAHARSIISSTSTRMAWQQHSSSTTTVSCSAYYASCCNIPLARAVHWPACTVAAHPSQNGSSRARSQSDNGVAELMPCQEPSDVEDISLTHYAPILFLACSMLRATC